MPNLCNFSISVKGEPKEIKKFLKYFIFSDETGTKEGKYLARTFLDNWTHKEFLEEHKDEIKNKEVFFFGWSAWSCYSCWFEGYPNGKDCLTMEEVLKKCKVIIDVESEEGGIGFEEHINNEDGELTYSVMDMPSYTCKKCKKKTLFPSHYDGSELEDQECCSCGVVGKWK